MSDDMLGTLKGLLGDNADEKIQSVLSMLGTSESKERPPQSPSTDTVLPSSQKPSINPEMLQFVSNFKSMVDDMGRANDSRSSLLLALKPYMRSTRQKSIDNAIKLLNITRMTGLFK